MASDEPKSLPGITGIILCGGEGRRVSGADKPLLDYRGRPLIEWVLEAVQPQVDNLLISTNRNANRYGTYAPVVADELPIYAGPLAGIVTCLKRCKTELAFICPGDTPHLATDLVGRMHQALHGTDAIAAVAHDGVQRQNLHLVLSCSSIDSLSRYLADGHRSVYRWLDEIAVIEVDLSDQAANFQNLNSPEDFA